MLFFLIELDEERILKDDLIDLEAAYECIDETFAQEQVSLYEKEGPIRLYTRNIDKDDFSCLWMVNLAFKKKWFGHYIKQWKFYDIDERTKEIYTEEDLLEEWVERPVLSTIQKLFKS